MRFEKASVALSILLLLLHLTGSRTAAAQSADVETGPLDALREQALSLVNDARDERGLGLLEPAGPLNKAAQAHAEDMLARDYYSHVSPEGEDVQDRYLEHGGSRWRFVAENIATCGGCPTPPTASRVDSFHEGWMDSPEHRQNILAPGLDAFGFGIAARGGRAYAVQSFAGPGTSPGGQAGDEPTPLSPEAQLREALDAVNGRRQEEGLPPLEPSDALTTVASRALAGGSGDQLIDRSADLFSFLPGDRADWRMLNVMAGACGGCGTKPTAADVGHFTGNWLSNAQYHRTLLSGDVTHLGFAMNASGEGRKTAMAVVGARR